jgi:hypothetical protein
MNLYKLPRPLGRGDNTIKSGFSHRNSVHSPLCGRSSNVYRIGMTIITTTLKGSNVNLSIDLKRAKKISKKSHVSKLLLIQFHFSNRQQKMNNIMKNQQHHFRGN